MRPPVHPLTASTLRRAHALAVRLWRAREPIPEGVALLHLDYLKWRRRVARGEQPDTRGAGALVLGLVLGLVMLAPPRGDRHRSGRHRCPVRGCSASVPDRLLMCGHHWGMVPANLQVAVYAAYNRGAGLIDGVPSEALSTAQRAAVDAVNALLYPTGGGH